MNGGGKSNCGNGELGRQRGPGGPGGPKGPRGGKNRGKDINNIIKANIYLLSKYSRIRTWTTAFG